MPRLKYLTTSILAAGAFCISNPLFANGCPEFICSGEEIDAQEVTEQVEESKSRLKEIKREVLEKSLDSVFAVRDSLPGSSCFANANGIDFTSFFVELSSGYPKILKGLLDKAVGEACAAATAALNSEVAAANDQLNEWGSELSSQTDGLLGFSSETNNTGDWNAEVEAKSIRETEQIKELSKTINEEFNNKLYGDEYGSGINRPGDIDLSDKRYYNDDARVDDESLINESLETGRALDSRVDQLGCWISGSCGEN